MKQFLRYQISGTVFLLWLVIFYYGKKSTDLETLTMCIFNDLTTIKSLTGLLSALPIGVIIHQFSVNFKNWVVAPFCSEFSDYPNSEIMKKQNDTCKYCLEKISNLNSFYYVRFDNGLLAPLFAWLIVNLFTEGHTNWVWSFLAILIGVVLIAYIPRLRKEIREYNAIIHSTSQKR